MDLKEKLQMSHRRGGGVGRDSKEGGRGGVEKTKF